MSPITASDRTDPRAALLAEESVATPLPLAEELVGTDPGELVPSELNVLLYRPIRDDDHENRRLSACIASLGVVEPIVATLDGHVLSGHRRLFAAIEAGLATVPVRRLRLNRAQIPDATWIRLLRDLNLYRNKRADELLNEELLDIDPPTAHRRLKRIREDREKPTAVDLQAIDTARAIKRSKLSDRKSQMVRAVVEVLREHHRFLPISLRKIHYELAQAKRPLKNTGDPNSVYRADQRSYDTLVEDVARMRTEEIIPHDAIEDATRPTEEWATDVNAAAFLSRCIKEFAQGFRRDLLQSQHVHVELLVEKNTVYQPARLVASQYCVPVTSLRGQPSTPVRHLIAKRFQKSGKRKLVLLVATDFDPSGEAIADSVARSLRQEHGCRRIEAFKFAVTADHARQFGLLPNHEGLGVKKSDVNAKRFLSKYGDDAECYELEALPTREFQALVADAIEEVIDMDLLRAEAAQEEQDAVDVERAQALVIEAARSTSSQIFGDGE